MADIVKCILNNRYYLKCHKWPGAKQLVYKHEIDDITQQC